MAVHIEKLNIESFRGIRDLSLENLNLVNIIAGDNNSGKTSILESLMFLCDPKDFNNILRIARARDVKHSFANTSLYENFINLFPKNIDKLRVSISGVCKGDFVSVEMLGEQSIMLLSPDDLFQNQNVATRTERKKQYPDGLEANTFKGKLFCTLGESSEEQTLEFHTHSRTVGRGIGQNSYLNVIYLSPLEHMSGNIFDKILRDDQYKEICINVLRLFDPQISDLLYLKNELTGQTVEYIKHETLGNMPISTYGDGIKKVLSLSNGIAQAANGVLMIDELETAMHAKYYDDIFRFMIKACKQFHVQLFITTHNMEVIDKLLATQGYDNQEDTDDIAVITFKKESGNTQTLSRTLLGRRAHSNREEFGFEVRL
ncbi:MAG: AAA family ATPase [Oscillospiraceae bacterium]|nr:AAA family ATPase [Oscillospiraceae bacterium]MCL2250125.1 AAA family ATPase [Oscillospiraceae bacterium]